MSAKNNSEKTLSRIDLICLAIGNVIGGGIMSLVGIAIGMTGRSVVLALILCSVMVLLAGLPQFFVASSIRMRGGFYTQAALFGGTYFAGVYATIFISFFFGAALYALSFADYVSSFLPGVNMQAVALVLLTVIAVLHILGIKIAAKAQIAMVVILVLALLMFGGFGLSHVKPGFTESPDWLTGGFAGFMGATALMSFATTGSTFIVNFSRQCKNPTKDIPIAILCSTGIITLIYLIVAIVAAGVLPLETVANESLALTAFEVLPFPVYLFFMIGGAMFALVTSLNALFGWVVPPIVQASADGWFPKILTKTNKKFNTSHLVIIIIYALACGVILFGWNIGTIANVGNFLSNCLTVILCLAMIRMPKIIPAAWQKSTFRINNNVYYFLCVAGAAVSAIFCYYLADGLTSTEVIFTFIYLAVSLVYPAIRTKVGGGIRIDTDYEEV